MEIYVPEISKAQVGLLATDLDQKGFGLIPNYIPSRDLLKMQNFVASAMVQSGNQYMHFNGPDAVHGSGLDELAHSSSFKTLLYELYEKGTGRTAPKQEFYQVLRCLSGPTGQKNSMIFHYDSYVVTALIPILIPEEGKAGDLLMYPNTRKIRKSYLRNAVDKVMLDNALSQRLLRSSVDKKWLSPVRIKMQPGSLYFFWGYRSIHTNEPCDPDKVRATALFHFANPHSKVN
jgi:hypothetical protein